MITSRKSLAFQQLLPACYPPAPAERGAATGWAGSGLSSPGPGRGGDQLRSGAVFSGERGGRENNNLMELPRLLSAMLGTHHSTPLHYTRYFIEIGTNNKYLSF